VNKFVGGEVVTIRIQNEIPKKERMGDVVKERRHPMHATKSMSGEILEDFVPQFVWEVESVDTLHL
jgi:hypothetical protein